MLVLFVWLYIILSAKTDVLWKSIQNLSEYGPVYCSNPNAIFETKLESTYYNVVEFIKWWNKQHE